MDALSNPSITILMVSHNKPMLLLDAIDSVLHQTHTAWDAILIDSGILYDQSYFDRYPWAADPRITIVRSHETSDLRRRKAMAPWCFNECFRRSWVRGDLVMYLCDDDILYPNAFATFVDAFSKNPRAMAMYASQDVGWIGLDGKTKIIGERRALTSGGKYCNGRIMDCQVDYLQLCHRRNALNLLPDSTYWPEDISVGDHADGLFMEKLGSYFEIYPIDVKVSQNRRTPWSVNLPAESHPGTLPSLPVHESIMDRWSALRSAIDMGACAELGNDAAEFQRQLRLLCEQDHAQRHRLLSRRYRIADKLHRIWSRVLGKRDV